MGTAWLEVAGCTFLGVQAWVRFSFYCHSPEAGALPGQYQLVIEMGTGVTSGSVTTINQIGWGDGVVTPQLNCDPFLDTFTIPSANLTGQLYNFAGCLGSSGLVATVSSDMTSCT